MASKASQRERAMTTKFTYSHLPANSIRLLQVHTAAGYSDETPLVCHPGFIPDDEIVCTLSIADLRSPPPFDALSYTWGNPFGVFRDRDSAENTGNLYRTKVPIICDKSVVMVGTSLYDALVALRRLKRKHNPTTNGST